MSFPDCTTNKMTMRDVAPLSIVFVSMMTLNNLCLQEVILKINDAKKRTKNLGRRRFLHHRSFLGHYFLHCFHIFDPWKEDLNFGWVLKKMKIFKNNNVFLCSIIVLYHYHCRFLYGCQSRGWLGIVLNDRNCLWCFGICMCCIELNLYQENLTKGKISITWSRLSLKFIWYKEQILWVQ